MKGPMNQDYYKEVNESLKMVFDLTSRIDERMKAFVTNYEEEKEKINKLAEQQTILMHKIILLESRDEQKVIQDLKKEIDVIESRVEHLSERLMHVEQEVQSHANKWATFLDFAFKIAVMVVGGLILWKLGLKP